MMKLWNKIYIHPLTYLLFLVSLLSGLFKYVLIVFSIVLIHELGHIIAMKLFKREITKITILPFGGLVNMSSYISSEIGEDLIIAVAGIGIQLILGFILSILNNFNTISYELYENIRFYNTIIISFNLLPIVPLDGAKIVKLLSEFITPYRKSFVYSLIISLITFSLLLVFKLTLIRNNILVFSFIAFSTIMEFKNRDYYCLRFYLERLNNYFNFKKIMHIRRKEEMYKNRMHIINNLSEKEYLSNIFSMKK